MVGRREMFGEIVADIGLARPPIDSDLFFETHGPVSNNTSCPWNWTSVA